MTADTWHEEERLEGVLDRRLIAWALTYARPHAVALVGCVVLLLILAGLQLLQPYLIKLAIDDVIQPAALSADSALPAATATLRSLVIIYVLAVIAAAIVQYTQLLWLRATGIRIISTVRADLFEHLQSLDLAYYDANPVGRLVTRVTNDVEALNEMYTSVLVNLFRDVFFIAGALIVLALLDLRLAAVAVAVVPVVILVSIVFRRYSREAWRAMRRKLSRINAQLSENFSGMRVIQIFGREARTSSEFRAINDDYYKSALHLIRVFATFGPLIDMLTTVAIAAVVYVGGGRVLADTLTFGTLFAFTAYTRRLFEPISALAEKYNILQSALAGAERITQLMDTAPRVVDAPDAELPTLASDQAPAERRDGDKRVPAVEFENVSFAYAGDDWVLRDVSLRVYPGEMVAFVGHTGAGKSTIMNLVPRFYDVQHGAVRVAGRDVRQWPQRELRRHVGTVMQDVFLFAGIVADNIHLDHAGLDREAVERAATVVGADPFIRRLPAGYDEPVVERGLSLSAGQRQLLSFARALAFDPAVLILDEATASIDTETEMAVQKGMRALASSRTTLVVAHRLSTIQDADRIYVMDHGRIVERGSHTQLLETGGLYAQLWALQFDV